VSTSSASPDRLDHYASNGREAVAAWSARRPSLAEALTAVRAALARAALPSQVAVTVPPLDELMADLALDFGHLDRWVGAVAR
jgi:hypothetical protein